MNSITYQHEFRPVLPTVFGAKDYREFRRTLEEMDHILTITGIEQRIIVQKITDIKETLSEQREQNLYRRYRQGLRYCMLLSDYRIFLSEIINTLGRQPPFPVVHLHRTTGRHKTFIQEFG